jgi:leucyl aminopeptidase
MIPVLKPYSADSVPSKSLSILRFFPTGKLPRIKPGAGFTQKKIEGLKPSQREPVKCASTPHAHDRFETLFCFERGTKAFALHEAIRKGFEFDSDTTRNLLLDLSDSSPDEARVILNAVVNLLVLKEYEPTKFGEKAKKASSKKSGGKNDQPFLYVNSPLTREETRTVFENALSQAEAANLVRTLAELPPNELRPSGYLKRIRSMAAQWGAKVEFYGRKELTKRNANAFLAVVRAEHDEPYGIVKLSWKPKGKKSGKKIALVGKGLCFDTGGYNVKPPEGMIDMHRDMTGSAVALALMGHLIRSKSTDQIECYLALAENLISAQAYRPNEVVTASNGVSIEVIDTDAEGRMVLSDTLVMACEGKPDLVIDYATLTGAVVRAIDTRRSGVFSNRDELRELAIKAGEATGERVWGFPIGEDYWDCLQSDIADLRQCAATNNADHIYAATFLSRFVREETPWLHVDLAAESHKGGLGLSAKDVTGFGIRLSEEILRRFK